VARRNVDHEVADLAARDRLEVIRDGVDVVARDEGGGRLYDVPGLSDVLSEAPTRLLGEDLLTGR